MKLYEDKITVMLRWHGRWEEVKMVRGSKVKGRDKGRIQLRGTDNTRYEQSTPKKGNNEARA